VPTLPSPLSQNAQLRRFAQHWLGKAQAATEACLDRFTERAVCFNLLVFRQINMIKSVTKFRHAEGLQYMHKAVLAPAATAGMHSLSQTALLPSLKSFWLGAD